MRYKSISITQITTGVWECKFYTWEGCYCSRKEGQVTITQERKPTMKDIQLANSLAQ